MLKDGAYLIVNDVRISTFRKFFSEHNANDNELFCIWGSAGFLEIAAENQSAAQLLKAKRDNPVILTLKE
jgi:S-adenosylmethionine hydrolase